MEKFKVKRDLFSLVILLLGGLIIAWFYPQLPAQIPANWGVGGEVNGYMNKFPGAFWGVLGGLAIYLFFYLQLVIDPLKKNYDRFEDKYWLMRDVIVVLFVGLNLFSVFWALDYIQDASLLMGLISLLVIVLGNYMPVFKRNWFLGIKTPWTISSEEVWNKTHRLGGKLFMLAGAIGLTEALFLEGSKLFIGAIIVASVICFGYSYFLYRKLEMS